MAIRDILPIKMLRYKYIIFLAAIVVASGVFFFSNISKLEGASNWYDSAWLYRKPIIIEELSNTPLRDYQVKIVLTPGTFNYSRLGFPANGNDLRFTNSDGKTILPYWIETWDKTATSTIWVKVPSVKAKSLKTIYMYYGNRAAPAASRAFWA